MATYSIMSCDYDTKILCYNSSVGLHFYKSGDVWICDWIEASTLPSRLRLGFYIYTPSVRPLPSFCQLVLGFQICRLLANLSLKANHTGCELYDHEKVETDGFNFRQVCLSMMDVRSDRCLFSYRSPVNKTILNYTTLSYTTQRKRNELNWFKETTHSLCHNELIKIYVNGV